MNPFELNNKTGIGTGGFYSGKIEAEDSPKDEVEDALSVTVDKFVRKLPYITGEEASDWANAIESLTAALANLSDIENNGT